MEYWRGIMNWPLREDWKCEICGYRGLIWGLVHAQCRCSNCHTQYRMRNEKDGVVDIPICQLKPEYYEAYKKLWNDTHKPIEEITDTEWKMVMEILKT